MLIINYFNIKFINQNQFNIFKSKYFSNNKNNISLTIKMLDGSNIDGLFIVIFIVFF